MNDQSDPRFDVDALFDSLTAGDAEKELDWVFEFQCEEVDRLDDLADILEEDFDLELVDSSETLDLDSGEIIGGPPRLSIYRRGIATRQEIKELAERMEQLAEAHQVTYEGVSCYSPDFVDEIYGWIEPDQAATCLSQLVQGEPSSDAPFPWAFLFYAASADSIESLAQDLENDDLDDLEVNGPDEEGGGELLLFVDGQQDPAALEAMIARLQLSAGKHQCVLEGLQFYSRDQAESIFGMATEEE